MFFFFQYVFVNNCREKKIMCAVYRIFKTKKEDWSAQFAPPTKTNLQWKRSRSITCPFWHYYKNDPIVVSCISPCRTYIAPLVFYNDEMHAVSVDSRFDQLYFSKISMTFGWAASKMATLCIAVAGFSNTTKEGVRLHFFPKDAHFCDAILSLAR